MPSSGRSRYDGDTRRSLIEAGGLEFARRGYAAARIRDIADAAGVNLSAVNYHFGGKQGLYHATLADLASRALADLPPEAQDGVSGAPERALHDLVRATLSRYLGRLEVSPLSRIIAHELLDPTPAFVHVVKAVSQPQWARLLAIVRELLGPGANEDDVALAALSTASQWAFYLFGRRLFEFQFPALAADPALVERLAGHITDFSLAAIAAHRERLPGARPVPVPAGGPDARNIPSK